MYTIGFSSSALRTAPSVTGTNRKAQACCADILPGRVTLTSSSYYSGMWSILHLVSVLKFKGNTEYIHNTQGIILPTQHCCTFLNIILNFEVDKLSHSALSLFYLMLFILLVVNSTSWILVLLDTIGFCVLISPCSLYVPIPMSVYVSQSGVRISLQPDSCVCSGCNLFLTKNSDVHPRWVKLRDKMYMQKHCIILSVYKGKRLRGMVEWWGNTLYIQVCVGWLIQWPDMLDPIWVYQRCLVNRLYIKCSVSFADMWLPARSKYGTDIGVSRNLHRGVLNNMRTKRAQKSLRPRPLLSTTSTNLRVPRPFWGVLLRIEFTSTWLHSPRGYKTCWWVAIDELSPNNGLRQQLLI